MRTAVAIMLSAGVAIAAPPDRAFNWRVAGHLHGLPVTCTADVERTPQTWDMTCYGPRTGGKPPVEIVIRGEWMTLPNGDLEFHTDYANARVVFRRQGATWRLVSSNVDLDLAPEAR